LKKLAVKRIIWDKDWAKTDKQTKRYELYQGDEMHFFTGTVESIREVTEEHEDFWHGEKFMEVNEVIDFIENELKSLENNGNIEQRKIQFKLLRELTQNEK
jgi:predicted RNA-binding protein with EMAP domain